MNDKPAINVSKPAPKIISVGSELNKLINSSRPQNTFSGLIK